MIGVCARRLTLLVVWMLVAWVPTDVAAQAAASPTPAQCSRAWSGHEAEIEAALTSGAVSKLESVPIGVTKPQRGYLPDGGPAKRFAWKALPPQRRSGYMESYKAEIAAYHLDRLLDLGMVPPAVERTLEGKLGAAILWIEGTTGWNKDKPPRGPEPGWSKQISRMKLFDQLIANIDRNQGNLLYDADWHLFLIDHSRAFTTRTSLGGIAAIGLVDRALWSKIDALTPEDLERTLGMWLSADERRAMLTRRDRMREAIAKMVKDKGQAGVFLE
jgi:hypothetical protein